MRMRAAIGGLFAATATIAVVGCGGGGSASPTPAPAPSPTPPTVTISGTAAKGAALDGATVSIKCASGTGTATTASNGTYAATITNAALPCVIKVTGSGGTVFHSIVPGTGTSGSFVANATPLTEMVVASATALDPAAFFGAFNSTTTVPAASVATATSYVQQALAKLADLSGVNPLTDVLSVGNALDKKIDAVVAGLAAAGVTVTDATAAIVQNPTAPTVLASTLAPVASDCSWLKDGTYRDIGRFETDPQLRFDLLQLDTKTLTAKSNATGNAGVQLVSDGGCQFRVANLSDRVVKVMATSGGLLITHNKSNTDSTDVTFRIVVPDQTLPISELAGTWLQANWVPRVGPGTVSAVWAELAVDANGQITSGKACVGLSPCAQIDVLGKFVANPAGGFDYVEGTAVLGRVFVYKALNGRKIAIGLRADNRISIAVPKDALTLPAVGTVSPFRQFGISASDIVSPLDEQTVTITAVDSTAKTVDRRFSSDNSTDRLAFDTPTAGLRYRAASSCMLNGAPDPSCVDVVQLPTRLGLTVVLSTAPRPAPNFLKLSIDKPAP